MLLFAPKSLVVLVLLAARSCAVQLPLSRAGEPLSVPFGKLLGAPSPLIMGEQPKDRMSQTASGTPLLNFEPNRPSRVIPSKQGLESSTITLVTRSFENSYYKPSIVQYSPSLFDGEFSDPSKWLFLDMRQDGSSIGRQFDRLGSVQLGGTEVWRTDNAEPIAKPPGIVWSTTREMGKYYDLFSKPNTLLFDYPNIVNDVYTGALNITLTLTAYIASGTPDSSAPAQPLPLASTSPLIFPLSKQTLDQNAFFCVGGDEGGGECGGSGSDQSTTKITLPQNAASAVVEIFASGTAKDEFWYNNLPNTVYKQLSADTAKALNAYPRGPYREVQLLIDGKLAGAVLPFPVIFTGGISPAMWRPQASYGAFNQPTYLIDISPFLGTLTDSQAHAFKLQVVSAEKDQSIMASWFLSGNVQVVLDTSSERTTGALTVHDAPLAGDWSSSGTVKGDVSRDGTLTSEVRANAPRSIHIEGTIQTGSDASARTVVWKQDMTYASKLYISGQSGVQKIEQNSSGTASSTHGGKPFLGSSFSYPLLVNSYGNDTSNTAEVDLSFEQTLVIADKRFGEPIEQGTALRQKSSGTINSTSHTISQANSLSHFVYHDNTGMNFSRDTATDGTTIAHDRVAGTLAGQAQPVQAQARVPASFRAQQLRS